MWLTDMVGAESYYGQHVTIIQLRHNHIMIIIKIIIIIIGSNGEIPTAPTS